MLVSRVCGIFECDLKKVIALSTLSQLGIMLLILGLGFKDFCFFHVIIHALFKSSLFIRMGIKIHDYFNNQDSRLLGGNWKNRGRDFFFGLTNLALIGFPFLSGFFSKDLRIEFIISENVNLVLWGSFVISIILTVGYSLKFIMLGGLNINNFNYLVGCNIVNRVVLYSVLILLFLRGVFGYLYFSIFFDFYLIIDIVVFIKASIIIFLYYLYIYLFNYILDKKILINKFLSLFRYLLFLNKLFIFFIKRLKDYMWYYKFEDRGYLDLVK